MKVQSINNNSTFGSKNAPGLKQLRKMEPKSRVKQFLALEPKPAFSSFDTISLKDGKVKYVYYPSGGYKRIEITSKDGSDKKVVYFSEAGYCDRIVSYKNNEKVSEKIYGANVYIERIFKNSKLVQQKESTPGQVTITEFDENGNPIKETVKSSIVDVLAKCNG